MHKVAIVGGNMSNDFSKFDGIAGFPQIRQIRNSSKIRDWGTARAAEVKDGKIFIDGIQHERNRINNLLKPIQSVIEGKA